MGSDTRTLAEMAGAWLRTHWNEVSIDEKASAHDPTKLRIGGWTSPGTGYLGILSFDLLTGDDNAPNRWEKAFLGVKLDPDPTLEIYMQRRRDTTEDRDMVRVLRLTPQELELGVPIKGMSAAISGHPDSMWSPNGLWVTQQQDDGNFVTYRLAVPFDKSTATAVWSRTTGPL